MDELIVKGIKNIEGMKFHDIEGGFGEGKKAMLVKDIAEIHERDLGKVNELINNNRKRFTNCIDIIDLKANPFEGLGYENAGYTKQSFNQSKNVYLLSERGYSKLLKILEDDVAWEQYEKLVDGYFNMRAEKEFNKKSPMELLELEFAVLKEQKQEIMVVKGEVKDLKDNMPLFNIDCEELQKEVRRMGIKVLGGKGSSAYRDKSIRTKVYSDIQHQIKRQFGLNSYKAIKRSQLDIAIEIIGRYEVPFVLKDEINLANSQMAM